VLLLLTVAAAGIRVAYVLAVTRHQSQLYGDQIAYARVAGSLADGRGFRDPFTVDRTLPNADHPPLTSILVSPAYLLFDRTADADTAARLVMALVGSGTVFVVGLAARRVAANVEIDPDSPVARRVGWTAAGLATVLPGLWIHDGVIMSEGPGALTVALVIWAAVRALDRPSARRFAVLGGLVGVAALARSEAVVLVPLLVVPLAFTRRGDRAERSRAAPVAWLTAGGVGVALVLAPWVVPNLLRFRHPVVLSTNDGSTLLGANCDSAYRGSTKGLWILDCVLAESDPDAADASVNSARFRSAAIRYVRHHLGDLPGVVGVRELRAWSLWSPRQEVYLNAGEGDEHWVSWAAMVGSWTMMALGAAGMVVLRHRDRPVWPLGAQAVAVTLTAAAFYGLARFRIGADVALLIGGAVAIESFVRHRGRIRRRSPRPAIRRGRIAQDSQDDAGGPLRAMSTSFGPSQAAIVGT
jgi:hypothetical protein